MKRRIYWSICGSAAAAALLTLVLSLYSFYHLMLEQARADLAGEFTIIQRGISNPDNIAVDYLADIDRQFYRTRMTLVDVNGEVLYDTGGQASKMENHRERPEMIAAFAYGMGEDIRLSETTGQSMFYYAQKLPDGRVLRIAKLTSGIEETFKGILSAVLLILLLIVAGGAVLSSRLSRQILRPIERFAQDMEAQSQPGYEEIEPLFMKIREQNRLIQMQVERLTQERDKINTITSNMKEGLILLDLSRNILSVNRSAVLLLDMPAGCYEGKNILSLSRSQKLGECIDEAFAGKPADLLMERGETVSRLYVSPVYQEEKRVCGAIILLVDVTQQQKAEKIRRDFSANVSHELKTPLTSISGFAELIENGMVQNDADIKKFAGRISSEASRLLTLTNDIIRLSRIEEEGALEKEAVSLFAVCESTAQLLQYAAGQKQVKIEVAGQETTLYANARMIEELVYNLCDNAVQYNRPQGQVTLAVHRDGGQAVLVVADTGIGIPREHRARIFERFYRVDKSRSKQTGGTGLGLSIVKHIVERHHGTVTLESEIDRGTRITVRLPLETE